MPGQSCTSLCAQTRHYVQRPARQACVIADSGECKRCQTGLLGRFQDAGIAHGKCCANRTPDDLHRIVPGNDMAGYAVRLAQGIDRVPL